MTYPHGVEVREKLSRRAAEAGLWLPEATFQGLEAYFELLQKWNQRVSLTSLPIDIYSDEAIDRLLIEPALAAGFLPTPGATVMDIGSGGGSPAIPIKLVAPAIALTMVESNHKKASFLRESIRLLDLARTTLESVRFEELLERPGLREFADVVTLRAVRVDPGTLDAVGILLKPGGSLFLFSATTQTAIGRTSDLVPVAVHPLSIHLGSRLEVLRRVN